MPESSFPFPHHPDTGTGSHYLDRNLDEAYLQPSIKQGLLRLTLVHISEFYPHP